MQVHGKRFVYKFICDLKTLLGFSAGELNILVKNCAEKRSAAGGRLGRKRRGPPLPQVVNSGDGGGGGMFSSFARTHQPLTSLQQRSSSTNNNLITGVFSDVDNNDYYLDFPSSLLGGAAGAFGLPNEADSSSTPPPPPSVSSPYYLQQAPQSAAESYNKRGDQLIYQPQIGTNFDLSTVPSTSTAAVGGGSRKRMKRVQPTILRSTSTEQAAQYPSASSNVVEEEPLVSPWQTRRQWWTRNPMSPSPLIPSVSQQSTFSPSILRRSSMASAAAVAAATTTTTSSSTHRQSALPPPPPGDKDDSVSGGGGSGPMLNCFPPFPMDEDWMAAAALTEDMAAESAAAAADEAAVASISFCSNSSSVEMNLSNSSQDAAFKPTMVVVVPSTSTSPTAAVTTGTLVDEGEIADAAASLLSCCPPEDDNNEEEEGGVQLRSGPPPVPTPAADVDYSQVLLATTDGDDADLETQLDAAASALNFGGSYEPSGGAGYNRSPLKQPPPSAALSSMRCQTNIHRSLTAHPGLDMDPFLAH